LGGLGKRFIADDITFVLTVFTLMELEHKEGKVGKWKYDDLMTAQQIFSLQPKTSNERHFFFSRATLVDFIDLLVAGFEPKMSIEWFTSWWVQGRMDIPHRINEDIVVS
jgi:hypothetical protein